MADDRRWAAVVARDPGSDGAFVYGVTTTGIYCRPSCPARRARREHVVFHDHPAAAVRAGFRPCQRCRPDAPRRDAALVAEACRAIEQAETRPSLSTLAAAAGLSRFHFHRVFKAVTGLTPAGYARAHRGERLRDHLQRDPSVTAAIYDAGFQSSGGFYAGSDALLGMRPSVYRAGGDGVAIRYGVAACSLGLVLVAASDKGVCAIQLGDDPAALIDALGRRFPKAALVAGDAGFADHLAKVVGLIEAPARGLALPLDIQGTAFQHLVWRALRDIPAGDTASYGELAEKIGAPRSARAVAAACAANPVAVAIPCHRVVAKDGSLTGYRWGVERKRALLERESS